MEATSSEEAQMTMRQNKEVVEELIDAFNEGDFDRAHELFAPEYVNHNPPPFPGVGADRAGVVQAMRIFREGFPDAHAKLTHLVAEGDIVVAHDIVAGTHDGNFGEVPATGKQASVEFIHIFRVLNGKIVERWGLVDVMGLMQQLGVAPALAEA
jgi:steroid delta-isomerase-like uncharacterized protein